MTNLSNNKEILSPVFRKIEEESKIRIELTVCMHEPAKESDNDFIIHSVNGCSNPAEYYHHVFYICAKLLRETLNAADEMTLEAKIYLLSEARQRLRLLNHIYRPGRLGNGFDGAPSDLVFSHAEYHSREALSLPHYAIDRVLQLTSPFALAWKSVLSEFDQRFNYLTTYIEYMEDKSLGKPGSTPRTKLPVRLTVAQLACFIKGCQELEIFDVESTSELCRILSDMIQTLRTNTISPKSLRNHIEGPSPEAIDHTILNLQRVTHVLQLMKKRLHDQGK